jgi:TPR repeat protein
MASNVSLQDDSKAFEVASRAASGCVMVLFSTFELIFPSSGHADGRGALARCYYSGRGVAKDDAIALSLAISSADSGSAYGQYVLGAMHFNGDCGFAANDARAAELWHLAAEQGHVASADWLSVLCATSFSTALVFMF